MADLPTVDNGFLLSGAECDCDVDFRCSNHDSDAEARYWLGQFRREPQSDESLAYDADDPKSPEYVDRILEQVDL